MSRDLVKKRGLFGGAPGISADETKQELTIFDTGNPKAIINLVPRKISKLIHELPPDLLTNTLDTAEQMAGATETEAMLRLAFWDEYFVACDSGTSMKMERIYSRVCSKEYFYKYVVILPRKLAYILHPPKEYTLKMRELLELGHRRIREILKMPLVSESGRTDPRLIAEIVKIVTLLENRVRGAVVHRVELNQKSLNVNMDIEPPKDYFAVEQELKMIEQQLKEVGNAAQQVEEHDDPEGVITIKAQEAPAPEGEDIIREESTASIRD